MGPKFWNFTYLEDVLNLICFSYSLMCFVSFSWLWQWLQLVFQQISSISMVFWFNLITVKLVQEDWKPWSTCLMWFFVCIYCPKRSGGYGNAGRPSGSPLVHPMYVVSALIFLFIDQLISNLHIIIILRISSLSSKLGKIIKKNCENGGHF